MGGHDYALWWKMEIGYVNEKQHHESEAEYCLHYRGSVLTVNPCNVNNTPLTVNVLTRDDTLTVSINSKSQSNLITSQLIRPQLSMTDEFKGVSIAPLTTSTYASWSVEMEALLRAKDLWKCTQVLAQDFMTTLEPLTLKEKDEIETKFDKALGTIQCFFDPTFKEILLEEVLLPKMSGRHSRISWKGKNLIPRFIY
jgi:hypothetical protein